MTTLSENEIEIVRRWLVREGVDREDLSNDLLDHLCCLTEQRMASGETFESAFDLTLRCFTPAAGIKSIQNEIQFPSILNNTIMKKTITLFVSLSMFFYFACTLFFAVGLQNQTPSPFSEWIAMISQFLICAVVLPMYWYDQYRQILHSPDGFDFATKRFAMTSGFLCSVALSNAIFFKLMHFPGGNMLFIIGAIFGMIYVPFYGVRKFRLA